MKKEEIHLELERIKKEHSHPHRLASISIGVNYFDRGFEAGTEWAEKKIVEKACKEYCRTCRLYNDMIGDDCECNQLKDFRKALEE